MKARVRVMPFRRIMETTEELSKFVEVVFGPDGVKMEAIDVTKTAFMSVVLPRRAFVSYTCTEEHSMSIAMHAFNTVLHTADVKAIMTLTHTIGSGTLTVAFDGAKGDTSSQYELDTHDYNMMDFSVPLILYDYTVELPAKELYISARDLGEMNAKLRINGNAEHVMVAVSDSLVSGRNIWSQSAKVKITCTSAVDVNISTRYLRLIAKLEGVAPMITVNVPTEMDIPLLFMYGSSDGTTVSFYLSHD